MRAIELIVSIIVGANAILGLFGYAIKRSRKARRLSHDEYQARLRADNDDLDRLRKELDRERT